MPWLEFFILIISIIALLAASKFVLRKLFNIKKVKKKIFSYNHINSTHRKVDWMVRITAATLYLIFMYQLYFHDFSVNLLLFIMTLIITSESFVRAYFEWKASPDPKQSILSLGEGVLLIIIVLVIIQFDVLNLLFS
ncbi:DUF4181 domain-containing protein [Mesobacillus subterraneus]|uniref:DUF4181 domain-containing protein n=1 Tax=Mesobacillus subterraneus TaxID=285983 RepID=UPI001CFE39FA|nr:DUF4181 domain-containing protein [Mesobacillus subterraneus]WLR57217.1 DUF4181 domain-containing protein [Mesobacillus subterraneus]